jgi:hypothetical protein
MKMAEGVQHFKQPPLTFIVYSSSSFIYTTSIFVYYKVIYQQKEGIVIKRIIPQIFLSCHTYFCLAGVACYTHLPVQRPQFSGITTFIFPVHVNLSYRIILSQCLFSSTETAEQTNLVVVHHRFDSDPKTFVSHQNIFPSIRFLFSTYGTE